jgi:hypothetical protein
MCSRMWRGVSTILGAWEGHLWIVAHIDSAAAPRSTGGSRHG